MCARDPAVSVNTRGEGFEQWEATLPFSRTTSIRSTDSSLRREIETVRFILFVPFGIVLFPFLPADSVVDRHRWDCRLS